QSEPGCPITPAKSNTQDRSPFRREKTDSPLDHKSLDALASATEMIVAASAVVFEFVSGVGLPSPRMLAAYSWLGTSAGEYPTCLTRSQQCYSGRRKRC